MKFKDIKQLTSCGNYEANYRLNGLINYINDEISQGLVLIPDFQRGHVWTEEQQIKFIEYFLRGGNVGIIHFNAPNWPSVDKDGTYVCVDGLQRLTAYTKFFNNEIPAFGYFYKDFEDKPLHYIKVNVNNLKTRKEVLTWYLEMNSGGTPHSQEEIEKVLKLLNKEN